MSLAQRCRFPFLVLFGACASMVAQAQPFVIEPVVLQGDESPLGLPYAFLTAPTLSNAGELAFSASLGTAGSSAIFIDRAGEISVVVATGDAAAEGGVVFSASRPQLNGLGELLYHEGIVGPSPQDPVIPSLVLDSGGGRRVVARGEEPAPGTEIELFFGSFRSFRIGDGGDVALHATTVISQLGYFQDVGQGLELFLLPGDPIPNIEGAVHSLVFRGESMVGVDAAGTPVYVTRVSKEGLVGRLLGTYSGERPVAQPGDAAPGTAGVFTSARGCAVNPSGHVAYVGEIEGGDFEAGLYLDRAGVAEPILLGGAATAVGGGSENPFEILPVRISGIRCALNDAGDLAFAVRQGDDGDDQALVVCSGGRFLEVARTADVLPGAEGQPVSTFLGVDIDAAGNLAFIANLETSQPFGFRQGVFRATRQLSPAIRAQRQSSGRKMRLRVTLLGSERFDVAVVDHDSLRLSDGTPPRRRPRRRDWNGDGHPDLRMRFTFEDRDPEVCVRGETLRGRGFEACTLIEPRRVRRGRSGKGRP
jgi:hypothetical protein